MEVKMTDKLNRGCTNSSKKLGKLQMFEYIPSIQPKVFPIRKGRSRRAVSEIITTMLLLMITVIGALMVSTFFNTTDTTGIGASISTTRTSAASIKLIGYDTRDGLNLTRIDALDNFNPSSGVSSKSLCTKSCTTPNVMPSSLGTEFIVLKIRNEGVNTVPLHGVLVNDTQHSWDSNTAGNTLGASCIIGTTCPGDGKFSIMNTFDTKQRSAAELEGGAEVRLIIKLSGQMTKDIGLNKGLTVQFDTGDLEPPTFVIFFGTTR